MAEFQEVVAQIKRMCKSHGESCHDCPAKRKSGLCALVNDDEFIPEDWEEIKAAEIEMVVMRWAANHPGQRYPTWAEAWRQLFPAADLIPCPRKHFGFSCACIGEDSCQTCVNRQMYPFIAEKLGIKPMGGSQ